MQLHLKKSHYGLFIAIPLVLVGAFVFFDFDINVIPRPEGLFAVSGVNLFQTYEVNNICDFSVIFFTGQLLDNLPRNQEDYQNYYPEEYSAFNKYFGNSPNRLQLDYSTLSSEGVPDELKEAMFSLFMKSSSINPSLESLVRDLAYADSDLKLTVFTNNFLEKIEEESPSCYTEPSGETPIFDVNDVQVKAGEIGLRKGDWVKYNFVYSAEGKAKEIINEMNNLNMDSKSGCTSSNYEWSKSEVTEINGNTPIIKSTSFCNGQIVSEDGGLLPYLHYIPVDVKVGDIVFESKEIGKFKVVGMEKREYNNKIYDVVKVSLEISVPPSPTAETDSFTLYYEKLSGMFLEFNDILEFVEPSGISSLTTVVKAIEINLPRDSNSSDDSSNS